MVKRCIKCEKVPKTSSKHTAYKSEHKVYCSCGNVAISETSLQNAKVKWNKQN